MANKKSFTKLAVLSLLGVLGLTACSSEVVAKPSGYDDDTVIKLEDAGGNEVTVYDNLMQGIYDEIRDGALADDVLDKLLYQYSISVLGRYNNVVSTKDVNSDGVNNTTLKEAAKIADKIATATAAEKTILNAFIKDHKAYWSVDADGNRTDDAGNVIANDTEVAGEKEISRVIAKWDTIEERIAEAMYKEITVGTYSYRNRFQERKFLISLKGALHNVESYKNKDVETSFVEGSGKLFEGLLDVKVEDKDVFEHFLHREYYQANYGLDETETENQAIDYVETEIIPDVYRQLLIEQYLFDEAYYVLGRSMARKVNVLAIAPNTNKKYSGGANFLMNKFVKDYVFAKEGTEAYNAIYGTNASVKDAFDMISTIWKGVNLESYNGSSTNDLEKMAASLRDFLVANKAIEASSVGGHNYYKGTEYGDLMEEYASIDPNPNKTDVDAENKFTSNGTYTKEIGLQIETDKVSLNDHVTSGWYIKDGGLADLPSDIKTRLFHNSVSVSLDRDNAEEHDRWYNGTYNADNDYNEHVARINGKYFLTTTRSEGTNDPSKINAEDILFLDDATGTYYIVEIEEAVSSSKLSKTSSNSYAKKYSNEKMEEIVNAVAGVVGADESYQSLSKAHWLEEMDLEAHDTVIYDYFVANFPDLFD
jgi:hypothetical protein